MRSLGMAFLLLIALANPLASAGLYEEVIRSPGWDVWSVESFGTGVSVDMLATTNGPALTGVSLLSGSGNLLGRAFGFVAGSGYGAQVAIPPTGMVRTVDANGAPAFFGGAGVGIDADLPLIYVVAWAAGEDIHRKIRISNTAGVTPKLTLIDRGSETFYFTSDDASTGVAAEAQLSLVEADAAIAASRAFTTDGSFFGMAGFARTPATRPVLMTLATGEVLQCPCEFMGPSEAMTGELRVEWQGVNIDLATPVLGGADVRLPQFG